MVVPDIQALPNVPNAEFSARLDVRTVVTADVRRDKVLIGVLALGVNGHVREFDQDELTVRLVHAIRVDAQEILHIQRGALLHDIGKMGVPDRILLKPDSLTEEEWVIMRQHPTFAYEMLSPIAYLRPALDIPYCHHERWDGTGYPRGLKAEQIPFVARIFAIADVWDALISDRPYRPAWSQEEALAYIREESGQHFDPQVVEAFLKMIG